MVPAGRTGGREREREGGGEVIRAKMGHLRRKGRKEEKKPSKRTGQKETTNLKLLSVSEEVGGGKEMEQKRLSKESSLVRAKSIHTIVCE